MSLPQRTKTSQEWNDLIGANPGLTGKDLLMMRHVCYAEIEKIRQRPLLVYATKFLEALPNTPNLIDLSDIDGFTD